LAFRRQIYSIFIAFHFSLVLAFVTCLEFLNARFLPGSNLLTFSYINDLLNVHAVEDSDQAFLLSLVENGPHLGNDFLQMIILWNIDIGLDFTIFVQELKSLIINVEKSVFVSFGDGSINHISGMVGAIIDLASQNVFALQDDLG